ncbi:uncharacterized protein MONBRDRAFT_39024 [Monosiga brevicollis MX1]|uniref:Uncharacterized protein n=1 Tax=Monosiga brevicollis TaxID=81824 RepID=A9VBR2_MONBE|nr:uncharacterized protein MONBRDRAFT_39024 [Monosiga brevicollis MX1]EDQ84977.1 predicted protein [Monosiga brevicollis MX1]|eukprot:XP_001750147.1 hypothetical protein [Monosiga brevicollis MX1]
MTLSDSTLNEHSAQQDGGAVAALLTDAGLQAGRKAKLVLSSSSLTGNYASERGGAIVVLFGATLETSNRVTFERNMATKYGGAVAVVGQDSTWSDVQSRLNQNTAPAVYVYDQAHVDLTSTLVESSSSIGLVDTNMGSSRPGALLCAHSTMHRSADLRTVESFDAFGAPTDNVRCIGTMDVAARRGTRPSWALGSRLALACAWWMMLVMHTPTNPVQALLVQPTSTTAPPFQTIDLNQLNISNASSITVSGRVETSPLRKATHSFDYPAITFGGGVDWIVNMNPYTNQILICPGTDVHGCMIYVNENDPSVLNSLWASHPDPQLKYYGTIGPLLDALQIADSNPYAVRVPLVFFYDEPSPTVLLRDRLSVLNFFKGTLYELIIGGDNSVLLLIKSSLLAWGNGDVIYASYYSRNISIQLARDGYRSRYNLTVPEDVYNSTWGGDIGFHIAPTRSRSGVWNVVYASTDEKRAFAIGTLIVTDNVLRPYQLNVGINALELLYILIPGLRDNVQSVRMDSFAIVRNLHVRLSVSILTLRPPHYQIVLDLDLSQPIIPATNITQGVLRMQIMLDPTPYTGDSLIYSNAMGALLTPANSPDAPRVAGATTLPTPTTSSSLLFNNDTADDTNGTRVYYLITNDGILELEENSSMHWEYRLGPQVVCGLGYLKFATRVKQIFCTTFTALVSPSEYVARVPTATPLSTSTSTTPAVTAMASTTDALAASMRATTVAGISISLLLAIIFGCIVFLVLAIYCVFQCNARTRTVFLPSEERDTLHLDLEQETYKLADRAQTLHPDTDDAAMLPC